MSGARELSTWIAILAMGAAVVARFVAVEERQTNGTASHVELKQWVQRIDDKQRALAENDSLKERVAELTSQIRVLNARVEQLAEKIEKRRR